MLWVWIVLLIAFVIIEAATIQLVTVWFAVGSFAAIITSFFTQSILVQVIVFAAVSVIALAATRPFVKKLTKTPKHATNADAYINKEGLVIEDIDNINASGTVKVNGSVWTARSYSESVTIPAGTLIKVIKIEGVKLIVCPVTPNNI